MTTHVNLKHYEINMIEMTTLKLNATENEDGELCQVRRTSIFLGFSVLPLMTLLINGMMLLAIFLYRRKLCQNNVYLHVASTLLANAVFGVLGLYQILSLYFSLDGYSDRKSIHRQGVVRENIRTWWAFYRAMLTSMFLVMCGNIGILVSAIRDTIHAPLLFGAHSLKVSMKKQSEVEEGKQLAKILAGFNRKRRMKLAVIKISFVWIVPLLYVVSAPLGWSCAWKCTCLSGCYPVHHLHSNTRECSRVWPPMRHDWIVVSEVTWFICCLAVITTLWRAIWDTKHHYKFCEERTTSIGEYVENENLGKICESTKPVGIHDIKSRKSSLVRSRQVLVRTLCSLQYLIGITILFVISTAPAVTLMLIDYLSDENPSLILGNGCLCISYVYTWVAPFLLAKCLSGLRASLTALLLRVCNSSHATA